MLIFFDGYDLVVLAVITPTMLEDSALGVSVNRLAASAPTRWSARSSPA
ncbi:MAG: hypothetical protein H0X25_24505 [Acidobacteriales bacterium]|nr:hypothetical protein [Terriglobales bacterium]